MFLCNRCIVLKYDSEINLIDFDAMMYLRIKNWSHDQPKYCKNENLIVWIHSMVFLIECIILIFNENDNDILSFDPQSLKSSFYLWMMLMYLPWMLLCFDGILTPFWAHINSKDTTRISNKVKVKICSQCFGSNVIQQQHQWSISSDVCFTMDQSMQKDSAIYYFAKTFHPKLSIQNFPSKTFHPKPY